MLACLSPANSAFGTEIDRSNARMTLSQIPSISIGKIEFRC